jgi:hypothetical protein
LKITHKLLANCKFSDGTKKRKQEIGHVGAIFPSKNLGCYGDGGAIFTMMML